MRKRIVCCALFVLVAAALASTGFTRQQNKSKRPSPPAKAECTLPGGKTITTDYSSPRMKGRKIFAEDGLVPFGKVWRAGANEATTFVTTADIEIEGKEIPAGNYTLFTIPEADKWTLIISKKTGEWGIPYPGEQFDLVRVPMKVSKLPSPVEDFAISYAKEMGGSVLQMDWETTRASVLIHEKK